ncbi:MAG: Glu-tRNA(Gln) amidotransferase subunit GatE [Ferroplasma sp.]
MKIGLEIHFQLKGSKLFCSCDTEGSLENGKIFRKLTPVMGEMGKMDSAVQYENTRNRKFVYAISTNSCLVEEDEEPPHNVDSIALNTAIAVSMALHCNIVDYVTFMRKIVVDGSNTSGFQRTGIVGLDGYVSTSKGNVSISTITLEEDAGRKLSEDANSAEYSLDRLGIPLIEISTEPEIIDEKHALETARLIGHYVMSMDNFRGEVDSIRQDVNFSMGYGRVEIKGVSKLSFIKDTIEYEIKRQKALKELSTKLEGRAINISDFIDVSSMLSKSGSEMVSKALKSGKSAYCAMITGVNGFLKHGEYHLGREFADVAKNLGIGGLMHSDEFPGYGISESILNELYSIMGKGPDDGIIIVLTTGDKLESLKGLMACRLKKLRSMDLAETRAATDKGETRYLRPLAGKERMYPETDIAAVEINGSRLSSIKNIIPLSLEESMKKLTAEFGLSSVESQSILNNNLFNDFKKLYGIYNKPHIISRLILQVIPELEKKEQKTLNGDELKKLLEIAAMHSWDRSTVEKAVYLLIAKNIPLNELDKQNELKILSRNEIINIIKSIINKEAVTEKNIIPLFKNATESSFNPRDVIEIFSKLKNGK